MCVNDFLRTPIFVKGIKIGNMEKNSLEGNRVNNQTFLKTLIEILIFKYEEELITISFSIANEKTKSYILTLKGLDEFDFEVISIKEVKEVINQNLNYKKEFKKKNNSLETNWFYESVNNNYYAYNHSQSNEY